MEARKFFVDLVKRRFVVSDASQAPAPAPTFFTNDVEPIELYFLKPSGSSNPLYSYVDYSADTIKLAAGVTSAAVSQGSWSATTTACTPVVSTKVAGGSGVTEVQKIAFPRLPVSGVWAIQIQARTLTVTSVTGSLFTAASNGFYAGQEVTLSGFTISGGTFANSTYFVVRPDKNNFYIGDKTDGSRTIAAVVSSGGGTATINALVTRDLAYDASAEDINTAFIELGFVTNNGSALQTSGSIVDGFFITYGGASSGIDYAPLTIVGNTLAAGAGVSANLAFTTTAFLSIVSAGNTSGIIELEITSGAQKQTMTMDCNFADDIIDP
jgi:hypothetical protein